MLFFIFILIRTVSYEKGKVAETDHAGERLEKNTKSIAIIVLCSISIYIYIYWRRLSYSKRLDSITIYFSFQYDIWFHSLYILKKGKKREVNLAFKFFVILAYDK